MLLQAALQDSCVVDLVRLHTCLNTEAVELCRKTESMESASQGDPQRNLIQIMHEALALMGALPPAALTNASHRPAKLSEPHSVPKSPSLLCHVLEMRPEFSVQRDPNLLMVVCSYDCEIKSKLPQWECMMEIQARSQYRKATAVLIRSQQQPQMSLCDLPSRHGAVLSKFT